jgi:K+-sensing histidine kinase KdpD
MLILLTKIILGIAVITNIILFLFVLAKSKKILIHQVLLLQIVGIASWTFFIFANLWLESLFIEKFIFASAALFLTAQLWFVKLFPENTPPKNPLSYLDLGIGALFIVISFIPQALFTSISVTESGYTVVEPGFLSAHYALFAIFYILLAIGILIRKYNTVSKIFKPQIQYLLWGYVLFFIVNLLTNSLLPVFYQIYFFNAIGPVFSLALVGFITYIILFHQFLDIRVVIQRGIIYSTLVTLIVGFYLILVFLIGEVFFFNFEIDTLIAGVITTLLGIFTTPILRDYFRKITDTIFFKDIYDYQKALEQLSSVLNRHLNQKDLEREIITTLKDILKVDAVHIIPVHEYIDVSATIQETPKKPLHEVFANSILTHNTIEEHAQNETVREIYQNFLKKHHAQILIPICTTTENVAMIGIGAKRSGDAFSMTDVTLLRTFALQAAVALEKAKLYQQVKEHSDELEARVEKRTLELKTLHENQKRSMLTISHGLQTPLTIIKGELHFLKKHVENKTLQIFENSIDDISRYLTNLLRLARLEATAHDAETKYTEIQISELISEIAESFELTLEEDDRIHFSASIEEGLSAPMLKDDVIEIVTNLLGNARKYSDKNRDNTINLSLLKKNDRIILKVQDTGIGITKDALPRIFQGFYREQENQIKKGTGLGLAIVKQLVQKYGGTIDVKSTPQLETTFTIHI